VDREFFPVRGAVVKERGAKKDVILKKSSKEKGLEAGGIRWRKDDCGEEDRRIGETRDLQGITVT